MRLFLVFISFLSISLSAYAQVTLTADNFLKRSPSGFDEHNTIIYELSEGQNFLFGGYSHHRPDTTIIKGAGLIMSPQLIKADIHGNVKGDFSLPIDSSFASMQTVLGIAPLEEKIALLISWDSVPKYKSNIF